MGDVNRYADIISGDDGLMIGARVKHLRLAKQLSQPELAKAAKISQPSLSLIERGHTKRLKGDTLMQLAAALGEDAEYIRTGRRPARKEDVGLAEADALAKFRKLSPANRECWMGVADLLLKQQKQAARVVLDNSADHDGAALSPIRDRVALEIVTQIADILERHGPDRTARVLAQLKSAATNLPKLPNPTGKGRSSKA